MEDHAVQTASTPEELSRRCRAEAQADAGALDRLTSQLCVYDTQSILTFGSAAAAEMGKRADAVLKSLRTDQAEDAAPLLDTLGALMEKLDLEELAGREKPSRFPFRTAPKPRDQVLEKYRAVSQDMDRAYIALKQYEASLRAYDSRLQALFDANLTYYQDLVRCIVAGEQGLGEIQAYLGRLDAGDAALPDADRDTVRRSCTLLERRLHDLRVSETAALQSLPMVRQVQANNQRLMQTLSTAFLTTIPIFRQSLSQAVERKRMALQRQAMEALDRRTRAALEARNAAGRNLDTDAAAARLEALEQAREAVLKGIAETRALQKKASACRAELPRV